MWQAHSHFAFAQSFTHLQALQRVRPYLGQESQHKQLDDSAAAAKVAPSGRADAATGVLAEEQKPAAGMLAEDQEPVAAGDQKLAATAEELQVAEEAQTHGSADAAASAAPLPAAGLPEAPEGALCPWAPLRVSLDV
jgi:hypothetical protein